ncbi:MAG: type II toxin-antitoxin system RelE/ParE family toxin [Campylobacterota bacterium]|nr:type II toxin-antitoxin system RelE/ParE family toxin [Campylobacterota bacterium]
MIEFSDNFLAETKKLFKKYRSIKQDLKKAINEIEVDKNIGTPLGNNLYKKRVPNSSIPTGKSGGFRIIIYQQVKDKIVLISIYSKTQKETLSNIELKQIIHEYFKD